MTKDMTVGSPLKLLLKFTIPLIFGNLFQQFYSTVDAIIVGRFLGTDSLAAVGSTGSINYLIIGFCLGLCSGFAIPVAQSFGAKDFESMRRYIGNIVWLCVGSSIVFTAVTVALCRPILVAMSTPANIIEEAYLYIVIIFAGIPVTILYNILASLLRALGDSRTPVIFLVMASIINIALDLFLIVVVPMGVAGAAIATVASQLLSGIACFIFILKKFQILHISRKDLTFHKSYAKRLCGIGIPMGLQASITAIGSILLQASVNTLGSVAVASVTAATKVSAFFACAFDATGIAMSTYGGQNVGARKLDRLNPGVRSGMIIDSVYSVAALLIIVFLGRPLITLFIDISEVQVIEQAYQCLVITAAFYIPLAAVNVYRLMIQGMGYSKMAMLAGVCEMVARGITGLFLVPAFGFIAACFASPIAWILADLFLIPAYGYVRKNIAQWSR